MTLQKEEKALAERQTVVAVSATMMEDAGLKVMVNEKDPTRGHVKFLPKPADRPFIVKRVLAEEGGGLDEACRDLESLPPMFLNFRIPDRYPDLPPIFELICNWLPDEKVGVVNNGSDRSFSLAGRSESVYICPIPQPRKRSSTGVCECPHDTCIWKESSDLF